MAGYAIKNINPNPFRHIDRYPIRREKVETLRESLRTTGFWGNVVARLSNAKPEIAYGHHRLVALQEEYGPNKRVDLIIRDLTDEQMLQIMARENMEEWGTSAWVEHETVRAVIEAYAEERIRLPKPHVSTAKTQLRYAPSFIPGEDGRRPAADRPYTAQTVADFIGWRTPKGAPQDKVLDALAALQFIEEGLLKEADFEGLTTMQAHAVIEEARKARTRRETLARLHDQQAREAEKEARAAEQRRKQAEEARRRMEEEAARARDAVARRRAEQEAARLGRERVEAEDVRRRAVKRQEAATKKGVESRAEGRRQATEVGRAVSRSIKQGEIGYKSAAQVAAKVERKRATGAPPYIDDFARRLAGELLSILDPDRDRRVERIEELIKYRNDLNPSIRSDLARTLEVVANRCRDYAGRLTSGARQLRG